MDRIAGRLTRKEAFLGSIAEVKANYQELETDFNAFSPELISLCNDYKSHAALAPSSVASIMRRT